MISISVCDRKVIFKSTILTLCVLGYVTEIRPLAESLYRSLFSPSELFGRFQNELGMLISVLNATENYAPCDAKDTHRRVLNASLKECHDVLLELSKMKSHFDSMDHQTQVTWERLKWGLNDLEDMKTRLATYIQNLTMLNTNMIMSSQANVENMLKRFIHEIRTGIRDCSSVSSISNGSSTPSDEETWREVRNELQGVGITSELFLQHREFITTTLRSSLAQEYIGESIFGHPKGHEAQSPYHPHGTFLSDMASSTRSEGNLTDQLSTQVETAGATWRMSVDRQAPAGFHGGHESTTYYDSMRPAQLHRGDLPLPYTQGSVTPEASTRRVYGFDFGMWAGAHEKASRIEEALHVHTRLLGDTHHPLAPPIPLEDITDWRHSFPHLSWVIDGNDDSLDCDVIFIEANIHLKNDFFPSGSQLNAQLVLDFGHPTAGDTLTVSQMENWTCRTRLYEDGYNIWAACHDLSKPQSAKVNAPFESSWWAMLFTEINQNRRFAEDSGQPGVVETADDNSRRLFRSMSAVQELHATSPSSRRLSNQVKNGNERMAILVWKFRQTRPGEVGTASWRRLIPPVDRAATNSPGHYLPSFTLGPSPLKNSLSAYGLTQKYQGQLYAELSANGQREQYWTSLN